MYNYVRSLLVPTIETLCPSTMETNKKMKYYLSFWEIPALRSHFSDDSFWMISYSLQIPFDFHNQEWGHLICLAHLPSLVHSLQKYVKSGVKFRLNYSLPSIHSTRYSTPPNSKVRESVIFAGTTSSKVWFLNNVERDSSFERFP